MREAHVTSNVVGTGGHIVFVLHGWFGSGRAWDNLIPHLDAERFTYVFPDYRGYGARRGEPGEHTIAEAAADVLALADQRGDERFSLVGHSMGGSVMQWLYADAPERVRALVGVSPVPASGVPFDDETWQLFSGAAEDAAKRRTIIDFTTGGRHPDAWLDGMVQHSLENSDKDAFAAYLNAWARTDFSDRIAGAEVPVKVFVGEHDPALGEQAMLTTFAQWYPKLELEVLPDAGHYAADEVPVTLANAIEVFLDQH
ncbi:alpha/beta hydrolase [Amycolatopsis bartoniae]|uniref:Esterase n=1 Tax=Amycolatopsis bartoniae TaxID=941986 RepID=A0A8H9ISW7_9PSEU|nr:alpha/beta hydrolase [Amycolatopsis bartoniae]TVT00126.1 alpha/beta hydrolase [Amycolatopsis bartoniae]GHF48221.1 esterase [Amycolatopsis bartoniae]